MRLLVRLFLIVLLCGGLASAQRAHRNPSPEDRSASPDRQLAPGPAIDPRQLRKEADELAQLASTVPEDVAKAANGILDKDLQDRLKKIEKLSKKLRGELALR